MKLMVEVELSEREMLRLSTNSIERVFNHSYRCIENWVAGDRPSPDTEPDVALADIEELKPIATRLWLAAHNAIFAMKNPSK